MARLIKTRSRNVISLLVNTYFEDGSISTDTIKIGDIVEDLRYVYNESVVKVTGKVTAFKTTYNTNKTDLNDIIKVSDITVDSSDKYASKLITIPTAEIVEKEGVTNVKCVHTGVDIEVFIDFTYTDGTTVNQAVSLGDKLYNMKIMTSPGKPDIEGNFVVTGFDFSSSEGKFSVVALRLQNEDTGKAVTASINNIISFEEIITENITSAEALVEALANTASSHFDLTVTEDITTEEPIEIPEGKEVVINLEGAKISSEGVALTNSGNLTLIGGTIESKGIRNAGTDSNMILDGVEIICTDTLDGAIINEGTLSIEDGTKIEVTHVGATSDEKGPACLRNYGQTTINGGEFESASKRTYCILGYSGGKITVAEGASVTINGVHGGICANGGELEIFDGSFVSTEYYGLYVSNDDMAADVVVHGGTFEGPNYSVWCGSDHNEHVDSVVDIRGGKFMKPVKDQTNVDVGCGVKISGGQFAQPVEERYCAEGFEPTTEPDTEGFYGVQVKVIPPVEEEPVNTEEHTEPNEG